MRIQYQNKRFLFQCVAQWGGEGHEERKLHMCQASCETSSMYSHEI